jgi:SAM-dependent methyltransferase
MSASDSPTLPWPGDELVYRVAGVTDREWFYDSGQQSVRDLESVLAVTGRTLGSFSSILDFGCGCGRILLWLEDLARSSTLHGVDIDARAIGWVNANLPYVSAAVNQPLPPLDYPDGSFDLVYNHSVFTHIDEDYQDQWLAELHRVTKPGATLVLSVHGEHAFAEYETASSNAGGDPAVVREQLCREGIAHMREDPWVGSAFPDFYHTTFHAPWYVFRHWGATFRIRAYVPRGSLGYQDFVVLERPPDDERLPVPLDPVHGSALSPATVAPAPAPSTWPAIEAAAEVARQAPDVESATGYGQASKAVRRMVLRLLRHYDEHQRKVHASLLAALREVATRPTESVGGLTLSEAHVRLWDALRREGERVSRLESDLWQAIEARAPRSDSGPVSEGGRAPSS